MQKLQILPALLLAFLVCVNPVHAWDSTGHSVVARIAWKNMNDSTKRSVIDALKTAPAESRIRVMMPANVNAWPPNVNNPIYEQLFQFVGTWPDIVRPVRNTPRPTDPFHHGDWHYRDIFWNAGNNSNSSMAPEGELIDKLREFSRARFKRKSRHSGGLDRSSGRRHPSAATLQRTNHGRPGRKRWRQGRK